MELWPVVAPYLAPSMVASAVGGGLALWLTGRQNKELAELRNKLAIMAARDEARYNASIPKVIEGAIGVWQRLAPLARAVHYYIKPWELAGEPDKDAKLEKVLKTKEEFWDYFGRHEYCISAEMARTARSAHDKLCDLANDHTSRRRVVKASGVGAVYDRDHPSERSMDSWRKAETLIDELLEALRVLLGVEAIIEANTALPDAAPG